MIYFPDKTLHRYTYTNTNKGVYGETIKQYTYTDDIIVDFQNENRNEIREQFGVEKQNLYKIYFDKNIILNNEDQLRDNEGNTYTILGEIMKYTKFHNFQKAYLIKDRK